MTALLEATEAIEQVIGYGTDQDLPIVLNHNTKKVYAIMPDGSRKPVITHIKTIITHVATYSFYQWK
jgi:hypothetical protein